MHDQRGAQWNRWDLHVHTPCSIEHRYPGNHDEQWEAFLNDLEGLPSSFKALGISDYLFLEGYARLQHNKKDGRLSNIDLLLPIIEIRLRQFAGTTSHLKRINAHVVFSDELSPETIETQFLSRLASSYKLSATNPEVQWNGVLNRQGIEDLGLKLIAAAPADRRGDYGRPLREGFNNITFDLKDVESALDSHFFKDKALLAVGKTEWDQIKWAEGSVADKRNVINSADFVYIAAADSDHFKRCKAALEKAEVNDLLIDCSDAHSLSSSNDKDRVGNCFTWIKGELRFDGLRHALIDPDSRVFVGDEPALLRAVRRRPESFIERVFLDRDPQADLDETWFDDIELPLNPGLVSVIGNRGTGKSALAEAIASACQTRIPRQHFSFLSETRFGSPKDNKARYFTARVRMVSGDENECRLSDRADEEQQERVAFLPQDFLEVLCSDPTQEGEFAKQLEQVVFSRVSSEDRLQKSSLRELVQHLVTESDLEANRLRGELSRINVELHDLEKQIREPARRRLETEYAELRKNLLALKARRPTPIAKPSEDTELQEELARQRARLEELDRKIVSTRDAMRAKQLRLAAADTLIDTLSNLEGEMKRRIGARQAELDLLELSLSDVLTVEIHRRVVQRKRGESEKAKEKLAKQLNDEPSGLLPQRVALTKELEATQARLAAPARAYEQYLKQLTDWIQDRRMLIGDGSEPRTVLGARRNLAYLETRLPCRMTELSEHRRKLVRSIHSQAVRIKDAYERLYEPVRDFIATHPTIGQGLNITLDVGIVSNQLEERILALVHQGRRGSFQGSREGRKRLSDLAAKNDFNDAESTIAFAEEVLELLGQDVTCDPPESRDPGDQIMEGHTVPELLTLLFGLEYLHPQYRMLVAGNSLAALSPGERGLTLLVFYLLVSQDRRPVIIDQPEGNLDNESIFRHLVPCLREAKRQRQIILVTHNPNLAVVCDSEQVVRARLAKDKGFKASYVAGAIETPEINRWLVDVLEGTYPAFETRRLRYEPSA